MTCQRCGNDIPRNELHHPNGYCSYECEKLDKQEKCEHIVRLEGIKLSEDRDGFNRNRPIYYCPECKLDWEK